MAVYWSAAGIMGSGRDGLLLLTGAARASHPTDTCYRRGVRASIPSRHVSPALLRKVQSAPFEMRYSPRVSPYPYAKQK